MKKLTTDNEGRTKMNQKEKLIEIINNVIRCDKCGIVPEWIAEDLIFYGVTVQEWVSVDDELPEVGGYVVCIAKKNPFSRFMPMVARIEKNGWVNPMTEQYISEITHWMPLPSTDGLK